MWRRWFAGAVVIVVHYLLSPPLRLPPALPPVLAVATGIYWHHGRTVALDRGGLARLTGRDYEDEQRIAVGRVADVMEGFADAFSHGTADNQAASDTDLLWLERVQAAALTRQVHLTCLYNSKMLAHLLRTHGVVGVPSVESRLVRLFSLPSTRRQRHMGEHVMLEARDVWPAQAGDGGAERHSRRAPPYWSVVDIDHRVVPLRRRRADVEGGGSESGALSLLSLYTSVRRSCLRDLAVFGDGEPLGSPSPNDDWERRPGSPECGLAAGDVALRFLGTPRAPRNGGTDERRSETAVSTASMSNRMRHSWAHHMGAVAFGEEAPGGGDGGGGGGGGASRHRLASAARRGRRRDLLPVLCDPCPPQDVDYLRERLGSGFRIVDADSFAAIYY